MNKCLETVPVFVAPYVLVFRNWWSILLLLTKSLLIVSRQSKIWSRLNGSCFFNEEDFAEYVGRVRLDGTYGDELCIRAFCSRFKFKVTMCGAAHGKQVFAAQHPEKEVFRAHHGKNHFDAVFFLASCGKHS